MIIKEELVYEYWDCKYCDRLAIRGDEERCTGCGHDRDKDITFYRRAEDEVVRDERQGDRFRAGPDWVCGFCQALNSAQSDGCRSCGAGRKDARGDYFDAQRERGPGAAGAPEPVPDLTQRRGGGGLIVAVIGALLAAALGWAYWATRTHAVVYEVAAVRWERDVPVLRYAGGEDSDWEDELRGDGIERIASQKEERRRERHQVGTQSESYSESERYQAGTKEECRTDYSSTGSGAAVKTTSCETVPVYETRSVTKTRDVPVYEEVPIYGVKVRYRSRRYRPLRTDQAAGDDSQPRWPEVALGAGEEGRPDQEGERAARYHVRLRKLEGGAKGAGELLLRAGEDSFGRFVLGSKHPITVDNRGAATAPPGTELEMGTVFQK